VVAVRDPWPTAAGGIERLLQAGIDVVDISGSAADVVGRARDVNRVWLGAMRSGRPFVTLKIAMSLDGRVAAPDGSARWISSAESRADAHRLRGRIDAIMVGVGTVLADDPSLTARGSDGAPSGRQPLRVVVDTHGRTPAHAKVLDAQAESLMATAETHGIGPDARVDIAALLRDLYARGQRHVLVEGGPHLAASFLDADLVDEVLIYLAPLLLGAGRTAVEGSRIATLAEARRLELAETRRLGPDLALRYRML
jgi:diaminohydroxyphosphoribosylaminopyrimidine deaminase/5-amino-6-(5-phosphoribosylamino)uracil reductase